MADALSRAREYRMPALTDSNLIRVVLDALRRVSRGMIVAGGSENDRPIIDDGTDRARTAASAADEH